MNANPFGLAFPLDERETLSGALGLVWGTQEDGVTEASVPVVDVVRQPMGLVHGGVYATIAETIATMATAAAVMPEGSTAQGLSNTTNFLRPIHDGTIHARGDRVHRGRTTWVWDVACSDDRGRVCAVSRVVIAVRPVAAGAGGDPPPTPS